MSHMHGHTHREAVLECMAHAIEQMEDVRRMVEEGQDCSDVLVEISAVTTTLHGAAKHILKDHLEHCIVDAVQKGDQGALQSLQAAIDRFIR